MPWTRRHHQLISAFNQNASQPIYRLSPELIGEIFLLARPEILLAGEGPSWGKLVRYLVDITSITGHFRRIALDFGELWSVVGFSLGERDANRCRVVLVMLGAFLERSRGRNLHFWFVDELGISRPAWFYSRLVTLMKPHAGRAQTFYFLQNSRGRNVWEELCVLVNEAMNLNKLALHIFHYSTMPNPPLRVTDTLHKLKELHLVGFVYDPSLQETMERVEILDLRLSSREIMNLHQWLGRSIKLKRLILPDKEYGMPQLTNPKSLVQLEDLTYLHIGFQLYQSITPWISVPNLQHLHVKMSSVPPSTPPHFKPEYYHFPLLRTLHMALSRVQAYALHQVALIIMNPQLEYLEMDWSLCEGSFLFIVAELWHLNERFMLPSGVLPTFPGPSLKYLRMTFHDPDDVDLAPLSQFLSSILSKASQLELDLICWWRPLTFKRLVEQFPSQVKCCEDPYNHDSIPLDELYKKAQGEQ